MRHETFEVFSKPISNVKSSRLFQKLKTFIALDVMSNWSVIYHIVHSLEKRNIFSNILLLMNLRLRSCTRTKD